MASGLIRWDFRKGHPFGLRLRLTFSYIILFSILLLGIGFLFRQTLETNLYNATEEQLQTEWTSVKQYVKITGSVVDWEYDPDDTEQSFTVNRLQRIFLLAAPDGTVLQASDRYRASLGIESSEQLRQSFLDRQYSLQNNPLGRPSEWVVRRGTDNDNSSYLILTRILKEEDGKEYLVKIGRSLDTNQDVLNNFTKSYFTLIPLLITGICAVGWLLAGRALHPLHSVVSTAQRVSGENLDLRIQRRGAEDELDHLIDAFNSMVDRLENSFNQVRRFSIDVSHELRTPLTAIRGELEVALMSAETVDQYREAMVSAIESVDWLSKIVRALLHLSQAETGQVALAKDRIDLSLLAERIVEQYQIPAEFEEILLSASLEPGTLVEGDKIQLERMVSNLLANAIKYTSRGGTVAVGVKRSGDHVELTVKDTGRGIPAEHLPHIFDRLYRVPDGAADPERGMGLGLSFVAWIAKAHDARIQVESKPGVGTKFAVTFSALPRAEAAQTPPAVAELPGAENHVHQSPARG